MVVLKTSICDLCGLAFKAPTALGRHKQTVHHIPGKSTAAAGYRKAKDREKLEKQELQMTDTPKETTNAKSSLESKKNSTAPKTNKTITRTPSAQEEAIQAQLRYEIPDGALTVALGRYQEFCRNLAFEYDVPPKLFTSRLTQFISHASKVW